MKNKRNIHFLLFLLIFNFSSYCSARTNSNSIVKDINVFTQNMEEEFTSQNRFFIEMGTLQKVQLGMTEGEVYQALDSKEFKTRFSFNQVLAKRLMKLKYIPITKTVTFSGSQTIVIHGEGSTHYKPVESLGVAFFFYQERLIYFSITHKKKIDRKWNLLPDSSEDVLYVANHRDTEEPLSFSITNGGGDSKYYGFVNGYLGEKFKNSGERYFVPLVALSKFGVRNFLAAYCEKSYYWEAPDYEAELQKSGYYKLKAKLDKDFENKTGYWEEKSSK